MKPLMPHPLFPPPAASAWRGRWPFRPLRRIEHVLVPLDFSEDSLDALHYAVRFVQALHARLTLLHVIPVPPLPQDPALCEIPSPQRAAHAEHRLAALALKVSAQLDPATVIAAVRTGAPANKICAAVWDWDADLIIAGTHGASALRQLFFGGVTRALIQRAPCPLLLVRGGANPRKNAGPSAPAQVRRFLVPVDFSPRSELAVRAAHLLAAKSAGNVSLLHVIDRAAVDEDVVGRAAGSAEHRAAAGARLHSVSERVVGGGARGAIAVRCGRAAAEIVTEAQEIAADLIVMTTHGRTGLAHLLTGSTAEAVLWHAPCPVLLIRDPAA